MSLLNDIIKESISKINKDHKNLTPDNYYETFCDIAKKKGVMVEDCQKIDKYINKLDHTTREELRTFNVRTVDELFTFLSSKLSRSNPQSSVKLQNSLILLTKKILLAISILKDSKAKELANASIDRLNVMTDNGSVDLICDKWGDFITSYDDTYLRKLDIYCKGQKDDFRKIVDDLLICFEILGDSKTLKDLIPILANALSPSIAHDQNDELANFLKELKINPKALKNQNIQEEFSKLTKKRIKLDQDEVKNKINEIDRILEEITSKFAEIIEKSGSSAQKSRDIKKELENIDFSKDTFESIQKKLINIAMSLENESESLLDKINHNKITMEKMRERIHKLENALVEARRESREDVLTSTSNRRALEEELIKIDDGFKRYETDYSLCFVDIDKFKVINDTFGHDAGDVILSTVGKILRKYSRDVDFVGRYGGEEFLILLPSIPVEGAVAFANKVREIIQNYKFLYKNEKINVTVSCGVTQRSNFPTQKDAIKKADNLLYEAKNAGRNRVFPVNL